MQCVHPPDSYKNRSHYNKYKYSYPQQVGISSRRLQSRGKNIELKCRVQFLDKFNVSTDLSADFTARDDLNRLIRLVKIIG